MVHYKHRCKCLFCKQTFSSASSVAVKCDDCRAKETKKVKKLKKQVRENKKPLMVNNPRGFNNHKKNPTPQKKELNQLEQFKKFTELAQKELISELGNKIYMIQKELRPLLLKFNKFKDYYDMKHFGWEWKK